MPIADWKICGILNSPTPCDCASRWGVRSISEPTRHVVWLCCHFVAGPMMADGNSRRPHAIQRHPCLSIPCR